MPTYPSKKASEMMRILKGLGYVTKRQNGSHRHMECEGRGKVLFSYHDGATIPPGVVRKLLTTTVGLSEQEAAELLGLKG